MSFSICVLEMGNILAHWETFTFSCYLGSINKLFSCLGLLKAKIQLELQEIRTDTVQTKVEMFK